MLANRKIRKKLRRIFLRILDRATALNSQGRILKGKT